MRRTLTHRRLAAATGLLALLAVLVGSWAWALSAGTASPPKLATPSSAGLNYAFPHTLAGEWVGTRWLRSESNGGSWESTRQALAADLDFIQRHNLGKVMRIFIGLDQAMVWDPTQGFVGFDDTTLQHFSDALDMFDARGMRVVAVIYDQEEVASSGNFHFEAIDENHPAMRDGYLRATGEFLARFGARQTVIGWDLFNEAYNSLGRDGHLPSPPHADPVSPNYSDQVVHGWLLDLYRTARNAAPRAQFTVSDTTELYWNPDPDLGKYQDVVDFYDIHVYDDNPTYPNWRWLLRKPYILGEAGASTANQHYDDQAINSKAVTYLLEHSQPAGVSFVLVQGNAFAGSRDSLTPTGAAVAAFLTQSSNSADRTTEGANPADAAKAAVVSAARRIRRLFAG